jgi:hypothetical protein
LEILPRKGPKAFQVFKEALSKKQPHLHQLLMEQGDVSDKASACELSSKDQSEFIGWCNYWGIIYFERN